MKKLISFALCAALVSVAFTSCKNDPKPDGVAALESFTLTKSLNSSLDADINCTIDGAAGTLGAVIKKTVTTNQFIPTFKATKDDVVKVGGTVVESSTTSCTIADGTTITVSDEVSGLSTTYKVVVKENDEEAVLVSVAFKQADNADLTKDVAPETIENTMIVRVPAAAFQKTLKVTATAGSNDDIYINGELSESGVADVDTSFPVDITVKDEVAGKSASYVVLVGKILATQISYAGEYTESDGKLDGTFSLDIEPKTGAPYLSFLTTPTGGKKNVQVIRFTGAGFEPVGGVVSETTAAANAAPIPLKFNADGVPYVMYKGGEVSNVLSVKKLSGTSWVPVGQLGFSTKFSTTFGIPDFGFNNGEPFFFYTGNDKNETNGYRNAVLAMFDGSDWKQTAQPFAGLPVNTGSSDAMFYRAAITEVGDVSYIITSCNLHGYYVYKMENGAMTNIVKDFIPDGEEYGIPTCLTAAAGPDGTVYVLAANSKQAQYKLYTIDEAKGTFVPVGNTIAGTAGGSGSVAEWMAFGVNPVNGDIVATYEDENGCPTFSQLSESGTWEQFEQFSDKPYNDGIQIKFSQDGVGYAAYSYKDADKIVHLLLYKIDYEEDILPE